jgi:hypothetical protein
MKNFFLSLFTDIDFDGDFTKVCGFLLVIMGAVGFFLTLPEWSIMVGIGAGMAASGKFSKQG